MVFRGGGDRLNPPTGSAPDLYTAFGRKRAQIEDERDVTSRHTAPS